MLHNKNLGKLGEKHATEYLCNKGYTILANNYSNVFGEIDIIARQDDCIVFVEVKTRENEKFGRPAEAVNRTKQRRIIRTATLFMSKHEGSDARFDVIEIICTLNRGNLEVLELNHIENAFF